MAHNSSKINWIALAALIVGAAIGLAFWWGIGILIARML